MEILPGLLLGHASTIHYMFKKQLCHGVKLRRKLLYLVPIWLV